MNKLHRTLLSVSVCFALATVMPAAAFAEETAGYPAGATVEEDPSSPTGYMAHFVFEKTEDNIASVNLTGPFNYLDPAMDVTDEANYFAPADYVNGMYAANMVPAKLAQGFEVAFAGTPMNFDEEANTFTLDLPITSGSFNYGFAVTYEDGTTANTDDPTNPSPAKVNPNSNIVTGDVTSSIAYGKWDAEKQSESPNFDYVLPCEGECGTVTYVEYTGVLSDDQDLGIYVPAGYDPEREEPYKTVYASHGGGGSEVDWFAMGHVDHIADNLGADIIIVTMDNNSLEWDFEKIEDNMLNYVIPYIEENYNVSTEPAERAFCGLSMGSMTTYHMFFDHPEAFGYFGAFSGSDMSAVKEDVEGIDVPVFYFTVGTCDIASGKIMPNGEGQQIKYEDFVDYLAEHPMDNVIDGGYVPGSHDWFTWSYSFMNFISEICWK